MKPFNILTIGYARQILRKGSREYERMRLYADAAGSLHIIIFSWKREGLPTLIQDGNLTVHGTHSRNRLGMLWDAWKIAKRVLAVNDGREFVVSAQDPLATGWFSYFLARMMNARFHAQVHGDYFGGAWMGRSPFRYLQLLFARPLLSRANAIRVVSERIKHSLVKRGIPSKKITVLPIRPELESFLSCDTMRQHDGYTFLYVGRLAPEKDLTRIVHAFALLHASHPSVRLKLVGSGREEEKLKALIVSLNIQSVVTMIPWTERIAEEMCTADTFVFASKHEAYGLVLVEAMAAGLPAVTADVGCVGEVFKDQEHGMVVREKGDDSFSEAMKYMYEHDDFRKRCGEEAKRAAQQLASMSSEEYAGEWVSSMGKSFE